MDEKSLQTLEFSKVLERLAGYAAFCASAELARALRPTSELETALDRQAVTREARLLLSVKSEVSIGGARDVRDLAARAARGGVLLPAELLDIKATLISARELFRTFERKQEQNPHLCLTAEQLAPPPGLIEAITRAISDRSEILDSASPKSGQHPRGGKDCPRAPAEQAAEDLAGSAQRPPLQESFITTRNGRYVIRCGLNRAGIRSIVHDQSSSGQTLFIERLVTVDLNNQWHELQLAERDEERRILSELSDQVGAFAACWRISSRPWRRLTGADVRALRDDLRAQRTVVLSAFRKVGRREAPRQHHCALSGAPSAAGSEKVVPIDVTLDEQTYSLGDHRPDTGGKDVTLKTVGLLVLMAQCGLHIPAQSGSALSIFKNVYADIGDEQSIEQSLSTFSAHITNLVRILRRHGRLLARVLDELGAGTDPQEGSALARAILAFMVEKRVTNLVATHYPELKAFAHATPGVINASMEFDLRTLKPTYHLMLGLPGRSNALAIAERLGLSAEIIESARSMIDPTELKAEDLLNEIHHQRSIARKARGAADRARFEAEQMRKELALRLERIEDERQAILEKARASQEEELNSLRAEMDELRRELTRAHQPLDALKPMQDRVESLLVEVEKPV
jgi:DNA mismatch repair protein MutS2